MAASPHKIKPTGSVSSAPEVHWEMISPAGPTLCNHAGCIINHVLYIHGGINKKLSKEPLRAIYSMELKGSRIWQEVRASNAPALSHHACVAMENRFMVLIGGWDGKVRTTQVWVYDTLKQEWLSVSSSGFPEGGGLSSHTASLLGNGDILICGRDGSTRTHRRHGDAYILCGDVERGVFRYERYPVDLESRSGHTAHIMDPSLYIIGGRSDKNIEVHKGFKSGAASCSLMSKLSCSIKCCPRLGKPPCGRKHHQSVAGSGLILIHGGETFDGRSRDPVGEMFVVCCRPAIEWIKLSSSNVCRSGHVCCSDNDSVVMHGGMGLKGLIHSDLYQLTVP